MESHGLCGDGYARIGESSGSTNMLTGSGVDEAWTTGTQLGEAVLELLRSRLAFTQENLERTYQARRRASWVDAGAHAAARARNGFHEGIVSGLMGMMLAGLTRGRLSLGDDIPPTHRQILPSVTRHSFGGAQLAMENGRPFHDALLSARGWPEIPLDGRLLVTHQDALLMGGKVQAMPGYADHVVFRNTGAVHSVPRQDLHRDVLGRSADVWAARASRTSSGRSACTAERATGTAAPRRMKSTAIFDSERERAGCIRRKTEKQLSAFSYQLSAARSCRPAFYGLHRFLRRPKKGIETRWPRMLMT